MLQHIKMLRIYAIDQSVTSTHTTKVFGRRPSRRSWRNVAKMMSPRRRPWAILSASYPFSLPVFSMCLPVSPSSLSRRSALKRPQLDAMAIRGENQSSYSLKLELSLRMCNGSYNRISETINRLYKRETRVHHTGRGLLTRSANESKRSERGTPT